MIELRRDLYLNEQTGRKRHEFLTASIKVCELLRKLSPDEIAPLSRDPARELNRPGFAENFNSSEGGAMTSETTHDVMRLEFVLGVEQRHALGLLVLADRVDARGQALQRRAALGDDGAKALDLERAQIGAIDELRGPGRCA
jgi:hypothetical protein